MVDRIATVFVIVGLTSVASAAPLKIRNGRDMNVLVGGRRQAAVGLGGARTGWRIALERGTTGVVEFSDVTKGTPTGLQNVRIVAGALQLSTDSFVAGHAYTAKLRTLTGAVLEALVYLYPPRGGGKVVFGEDESTGDDAVAISEKGSL